MAFSTPVYDTIQWNDIILFYVFLNKVLRNDDRIFQIERRKNKDKTRRSCDFFDFETINRTEHSIKDEIINSIN